MISLRQILRLIKTGSPHTKDYRAYHAYLKDSTSVLPKGFFNLTIDFELAWSRARRGGSVMSVKESLERSRRARMLIPVLLELSEKYSLPITFATVAHVALAECSHRVPPKFRPFWAEEDWYDRDPRSSLAMDKDYYGADLLEKIVASKMAHEIASHSFSHIDIGDSETTREAAVFEIKESYDILKKIYPGLTTFIFPNNHPAYTDILKETGYGIYRIKRNHPISKDEQGLVQFPVGLWLSPQAFSSHDLTKFIDIGGKQRQIVHFWCHLYEFSSERGLREFFEPLFSHIEMSRKAGIIDALTIKDIVHSVQQ